MAGTYASSSPVCALNTAENEHITCMNDRMYIENITETQSVRLELICEWISKVKVKKWAWIL